MKRRSVLVLAMIGLTMVSPTSEAKLLSVIDRALRGAIERQMGVLKDQKSRLDDQLNVERQIERVTEAGLQNVTRQLEHDLSGTFDINRRVDIDGMVSSWVPTQLGLEGVKSNKKFSSRQALYQQRYQFDDRSTTLSVHQRIQADTRRLADAHLADATISYEELASDQQRISKLLSQIEQAKTTKEALDLNNRLQAESLAMQAKLMRMQAEGVQEQALIAKREVTGSDLSRRFMEWK